MTGSSMTEEPNAKIGQANRGKERSQACKDAHALQWDITTPGGAQLRITNLLQFCRDHGLQQPNMWAVANGLYAQHKGFTCRRVI